VVNFVGLELLHRRFLVLFIESGCWVSLIYGDCMESPVYLADFLCYRGSRRGTVVVVKST
jgi:hypothetical protein